MEQTTDFLQSKDFLMFLSNIKNEILAKLIIKKYNVQIEIKLDNYEGELLDDKKHGKGKCIFNNGDIYDGEWSNNEINGYGTMKYKNGNKYEGEWLNGKKHGKGKCIFDNGDIYNGEWSNAKMDGYGTMKYKNGNKYEGEWLNGNTDGKGKCIFRNGDIYDGKWSNNKINGYGTMKYKNGNEYEGEWLNNKKLGNGKFKDSKTGFLFEGIYVDGNFFFGKVNENGNIYEGYYLNNHKSYGIMKYKNGDIYEGMFCFNENIKKSENHGMGIMKYNNGDVYDGMWDHAKKNGFGTYTHKNLSSFTGYYKNDVCSEGKFIMANNKGDKVSGYYDNKMTDWIIEFKSGDKLGHNLWACRQILTNYFGQILSSIIRNYYGNHRNYNNFHGINNGYIDNDNDNYDDNDDIYNDDDGDDDDDYDDYGDDDESTQNGTSRMIVNTNIDTNTNSKTSENININNIFTKYPNVVKYYSAKTNEIYLQKWKNNILTDSIIWKHSTFDICINTKVCKNESEYNNDILCPISHDVMINPVITSCGHIFDKKNLLKHFYMTKKMVCPICRQNIMNMTNKALDYKLDYYVNNTKVSKTEINNVLKFFS